MDTFNLLINRLIALFLNAKDKLLVLARASKQWRKLVYSGYAWEYLFDSERDKTWEKLKIDQHLFKSFHHFKGINTITIQPNGYCLAYLLANLDQIQNIQLSEKFSNSQMLHILKNKQIYKKALQSNNKIIKRVFIVALYNLIDQADEQITSQNINQFDSINSQTPLIWAIQNLNKEMAQIIIDKGADVNLTAGSGHRSPIIYATITGSKDLIQLLIVNGANINTKDNGGRSPIFHASMTGHVEVLQFLVEQGAYIYAKNHFEECVLHNASSFNQPKVIQYLVKVVANLDQPDYRQQTPLHHAVQKGALDAVKCLIQNGADINAKNYYYNRPLHFAAYHGFFDIVKYLVENGADINAKNYHDQKTALRFAEEKAFDEIVEYLKGKGAE